jgi:hypothetical protein
MAGSPWLIDIFSPMLVKAGPVSHKMSIQFVQNGFEVYSEIVNLQHSLVLVIVAKKRLEEDKSSGKVVSRGKNPHIRVHPQN